MCLRIDLGDSNRRGSECAAPDQAPQRANRVLQVAPGKTRLLMQTGFLNEAHLTVHGGMKRAAPVKNDTVFAREMGARCFMRVEDERFMAASPPLLFTSKNPKILPIRRRQDFFVRMRRRQSVLHGQREYCNHIRNVDQNANSNKVQNNGCSPQNPRIYIPFLPQPAKYAGKDFSVSRTRKFVA